LTPRIKQAIRSAIAVMRSYDPSAARNQVADQRDGSHAGRRDDTARAELQFGNGRAEQIARRISRAGVVISTLLAKALECERGAEVNRGYDGARGVIRLEARTYGLCNLAQAVAHDTPSRATVNIRRNCSVSLRKASCPYIDESSCSRA